MNCVQDSSRRTATGDGTRDCIGAIKEHNPRVVTLECVDQLAEKDKKEGTSMSDAEFICEELKSKDYWTHSEHLSAIEHGGFAPRHRLYWVGLHGRVGDPDDHLFYFTNVLRSTTLDPDQCAPASDFILLDDALRQHEAEAMGFKTMAFFGPRKSAVSQDGRDWKLDHHSIWSANCLPWPFGVNALQFAHVCFNGLLPREIQAAIFCGRVMARKLRRFAVFRYIPEIAVAY